MNTKAGMVVEDESDIIFAEPTNSAKEDIGATVRSYEGEILSKSVYEDWTVLISLISSETRITRNTKLALLISIAKRVFLTLQKEIKNTRSHSDFGCIIEEKIPQCPLLSPNLREWLHEEARKGMAQTHINLAKRAMNNDSLDQVVENAMPFPFKPEEQQKFDDALKAQRQYFAVAEFGKEMEGLSLQNWSDIYARFMDADDIDDAGKDKLAEEMIEPIEDLRICGKNALNQGVAILSLLMVVMPLVSFLLKNGLGIMAYASASMAVGILLIGKVLIIGNTGTTNSRPADIRKKLRFTAFEVGVACLFFGAGFGMAIWDNSPGWLLLIFPYLVFQTVHLYIWLQRKNRAEDAQTELSDSDQVIMDARYHGWLHVFYYSNGSKPLVAVFVTTWICFFLVV